MDEDWIRIEPRVGKGLGVVATTDIPPGTVIVTEARPLVVIDEADIPACLRVDLAAASQRIGVALVSLWAPICVMNTSTEQQTKLFALADPLNVGMTDTTEPAVPVPVDLHVDLLPVSAAATPTSPSPAVDILELFCNDLPIQQEDLPFLFEILVQPRLEASRNTSTKALDQQQEGEHCIDDRPNETQGLARTGEHHDVSACAWCQATVHAYSNVHRLLRIVRITAANGLEADTIDFGDTGTPTTVLYQVRKCLKLQYRSVRLLPSTGDFRKGPLVLLACRTLLLL